jgi:peptide/nickel transport system substrate-binding protein
MSNSIETLSRQLIAGTISRRRFMQAAVAAGLSAGMASAFADKARAGTPKRGGRFRIGAVGGAATDKLDPKTFQDFMLVNVSWQTRNNLVEIDHNLAPAPELAESWEASDDATQWTFKLRQGVEFHSGKTLDAEDVVYSINDHRGPDTASVAKTLLTVVEDVKADGKDTVVFTLSGGSADFPYVLADYHFPIVPAGTENYDDGLGTGGYILESFEPGVRGLTKRNPNYWKEGRAHFDEIETLSIPDGTARLSALRSGDIDAMLRVDRKTADRMAQVQGFQLIEVTGSTHMVMPMLTDRPPFDDNNLRLAMKHAIDREMLVRNVLSGHGVVGNDHPIAPINRYHASELPQRQYDPDKARHYLKKAGLDTFSIDLHASDLILNVGVDAAVLFKEHAAAAGIDINVVKDPIEGYWNDVWRQVPFFQDYYSGRPSEDWMFSLVYAADADWNNSYWNHEGFNRLLKEARAELNEAKRREMYVEMQRICSDEGGVIIPMFLTNIDAASDKVAHGDVAGNFEFDGWRAHERWWFA